MKDVLKDLLRVLAAAQDLVTASRGEMVFEEHDEYHTINFEFDSGNSKYSDCVVIYDNLDDFDGEDCLKQMREIGVKAEAIRK